MRRICIILATFLLCSCSKRENWYVGTWQLDVVHTKAMMEAHGQPPLNRLAIEMGCKLNGNSDYIITTNQLGIMMGGTFVGSPYSVIRRNPDSSVVILFGDTTNTMCWQSGFLVLKVPGDQSREAEYYYRRK
jgi:hypothetical protein